MSTTPDTLSLKPSAAVDSGGGLFDDFDGEITDARYVMARFGSMDQDKPYAKLTFQNPAADRPFDEHYSMGDMAGWQVSPDGHTLTRLAADAKALGKGTQWYLFLERAVAAGFPEDQMGADITVFAGTKGHLKRIEPVRRGKPLANPARPRPCLTRIDQLPWAKTTTAAKGGKANGEAAPENVEVIATETLTKLLATAGDKGLDAKDINSKGFSALLAAKVDCAKEARSLMKSAPFLAAGVENELWRTDGERYYAI